MVMSVPMRLPYSTFTPVFQDGVDVIIQAVFRKTVIRDTVAEHAAQLRKHLEYGGLMSHEL